MTTKDFILTLRALVWYTIGICAFTSGMSTFWANVSSLILAGIMIFPIDSQK